MSRPRIVCVGNVVRDEVFHVNALPSAGIKIDILRYEERFGGPAATAAVAITHLGGCANYWGRIGKDATGAAIVDALTRHHVDRSGLAILSEGRTTRAIVTVDRHGERSIMIDRHGLPTDAGLLPDRLPDDTTVLLVDTRWPAGAVAALDRARARQLPAVLDADGGAGEQMTALIEKSNHVIFSSQGIAEYAGPGDPIDQLRRIAHFSPRTLSVTCGADGSAWMIGNRFTFIPAFPVSVADTTGCGDVFHGAYAFAIGEGQPVLQAARFASAAAALKAQRGNGWEGMPDRLSVNDLLSRENPA
jgi:sulfofructose kinase